MVEIKVVMAEMCDCGRLYKDSVNEDGRKVCSACYTGLSVEELKLLWNTQVEEKKLFGKY